MPASTLTSKGQVTIPKTIRTALGLSPGDRVRFWKREDGVVVMEPETVDVRSLKGLLGDRAPRTVSLEEMDEAIAEAASDSSP
jgi:antitoxin PrlF